MVSGMGDWVLSLMSLAPLNQASQWHPFIVCYSWNAVEKGWNHKLNNYTIYLMEQLISSWAHGSCVYLPSTQFLLVDCWKHYPINLSSRTECQSQTQPQPGSNPDHSSRTVVQSADCATVFLLIFIHLAKSVGGIPLWCVGMTVRGWNSSLVCWYDYQRVEFLSGVLVWLSKGGIPLWYVGMTIRGWNSSLVCWYDYQGVEFLSGVLVWLSVGGIFSGVLVWLSEGGIPLWCVGMTIRGWNSSLVCWYDYQWVEFLSGMLVWLSVGGISLLCVGMTISGWNSSLVCWYDLAKSLGGIPLWYIGIT